MGAGLISLFFTVGAAFWLYNKLQRYSGNNSRQSAIGASIAGVMIFIVVFSILHTVMK